MIISKIGIAQANESPFSPKTSNVKIIMVIWVEVFSLAIKDVTIDIPFFSIAIHNPVTNRSLKIISPTIQNSIIFKSAKDIKADETRILSANGSKNFPSGVT